MMSGSDEGYSKKRVVCSTCRYLLLYFTKTIIPMLVLLLHVTPCGCLVIGSAGFTIVLCCA
jgi:hypothetical protein